MKIYFAGSIRGGRDDSELYMQLIEKLKEFGTVLTEHIGDAQLTNKGEQRKCEEIYRRDMEWIDEADVVVAEVTQASLGVGFEIGYAAHALKKPVLCLYRPQGNRALSAMIAGCELITNHQYQSIDDLQPILKDFLTSA